MTGPARYVGRVRVHIDHIDNAGGLVWAVRVTRAGKNDYLVVHRVFCQVWMFTRYRRRAPQPKRDPARAWLEACCTCVVTLTERRGRVEAHVNEYMP